MPTVAQLPGMRHAETTSRTSHHRHERRAPSENSNMLPHGTRCTAAPRSTIDVRWIMAPRMVMATASRPAPSALVRRAVVTLSAGGPSMTSGSPSRPPPLDAGGETVGAGREAVDIGSARADKDTRGLDGTRTVIGTSA